VATAPTSAPGRTSSTLEERSRKRRESIVAHRATSYADAEAWDLDFWQSQGPEARLSALVAIRREVELVEAARDDADRASS
jgi:hypothetical protein